MDRDLIERAAHRAGIELSADMARQVCQFVDLMKQANQTINLTTITEDDAIARLHLEDSWRV
ncbi:MAG TPA: hypothetical protein VFD19_00775, partial [Clostridia bacterium]|nr:hypothetical protein [Clostridia bacterium]